MIKSSTSEPLTNFTVFILPLPTQLEKAWIWPDLQVDAGKCVMLTMSLMGYAETVHGSYYLEGDNKYESGRIEVPNPCNDGLDNIKYPIPFTPSKEVLY